MWNRLETDFRGNLARAGVRPEDVDIVINTHLHVDHVGWNTYLDGRTWVPTFPNATYLMAKADFDYWNPANEVKTLLGRGNQNVSRTASPPCTRPASPTCGRTATESTATCTSISPPATPPARPCWRLESGSDRALFVGDLMHSPIQIVEPDANSCFCEDPAEARATRHKLLGSAVDSNALVFPAHLGGHGAAEVVREGSKFAVKGWAAFAKYTEPA